MSYTVAKLEQEDAQRMADNGLESFHNSSTDEYFTYDDAVPNDYIGSGYDITSISDSVAEAAVQMNSADGTLPIFKGRKMYPR